MISRRGVLLTLWLLWLLSPLQAGAQLHPADDNKGFPWLSVVPDITSEGFAAEIQVSAVASEARPFRATLVQTRNATQRRMQDLRLAWFLIEADGDKRVLAAGQCVAKRLPREVAQVARKGKPADVETVAGRRDYGLPLGSLLEAARRSQASQVLLILAAEEVKFEDGETWRRAVAPESVVASVGDASVGDQPARQAYVYCPNQTCQARYDSQGNALGYECVGARGQLCENHGTFCINRICLRQQDCATQPDLPHCEDWWVIVS
ncbi:MAG: hypothetical protein NZ585_08235 [Chloracidobacterium sp.]|nr:hypothetical protein [Chloracidobacterium sp.]MDW8218002.1 hypothetical protein [Acidobacteriota bacterium]